MTPLDGVYCNALLFAYWTVRQKLNHVSSVQFSLVTSLYTRLKLLHLQCVLCNLVDSSVEIVSHDKLRDVGCILAAADQKTPA